MDLLIWVTTQEFGILSMKPLKRSFTHASINIQYIEYILYIDTSMRKAFF